MRPFHGVLPILSILFVVGIPVHFFYCGPQELGPPKSLFLSTKSARDH